MRITPNIFHKLKWLKIIVFRVLMVFAEKILKLYLKNASNIIFFTKKCILVLCEADSLISYIHCISSNSDY